MGIGIDVCNDNGIASNMYIGMGIGADIDNEVDIDIDIAQTCQPFFITSGPTTDASARNP